MYAKLIDEHTLDYAPRAVTRGNTHYNPYPVEFLLEDGYKPVIDTPYPDDGKYYEAHWEEQADSIVLVWVETEPPADDWTEVAEAYREGVNEV